MFRGGDRIVYQVSGDKTNLLGTGLSKRLLNSNCLFSMRDHPNLKRLAKYLQTPQGHFGIVVGSFFIFFVAFAILYPRFGMPITVLGILPILIGAWVYGVWAGIIFTVSVYAIALLIVFFLSGGKFHMLIFPGGLVGLAGGAAASLIMGWRGKLKRKSQVGFRQNGPVLEERANNARFLTLLNDILSATMETDDTAAMLAVLANRTGTLFDADNCFISFWDEKLRKTIPMAAYGPRSQEFFATVQRFDQNERTLTAAVLDTGHAFAVEDIRHSALISENVAINFNAGSVLGLPLVSGNRKLGAVILGFDYPHRFAKAEIEQAELAARQISLAVIKALLLEEAQRRVHELTGLHNISQALSLHGDAQLTFKSLSETLARLMGAEMCLICTYNHASNELHAKTPAYGIEDSSVALFHWPLAPLGNVWDVSQTSVIRACSETEMPEMVLPMVRSMGVHSVLAVALRDSDTHLLGAVFTANKPGGFSADDTHLLEILGRQVSVIMQNIQLFLTERTMAGQMSVLYSIAEAATQAGDEDQLIEQVTQIIGQKLYSDSFGILLLDEKTNELYLHSSYRVGANEGQARILMGVGITGMVAVSGRPQRLGDVTISQEYLSLYPLTRSELCVPLKVESKMLGVINVESAKNNAFTVEDEELLTIIAGQLATAIQRLRTVMAERFQNRQLEHSNSLIRALAQVNTRASVAVDLQGVLKTLGNELTKLGLRCAIALSESSDRPAILHYISLADQDISILERVGGIRLQDKALPNIQPSPNTDLGQMACLIENPLAMLKSWTPDFSVEKTKEVFELIGVIGTTSVCYLPLITDGRSMGILWMWGEGLHDRDLPTMSLFASQLAAAIQNANLLSEVGRLAITDELTGIFNRRHFFELADELFLIAKRNKRPLTAVIADLDHFKKFNDNYGHLVGDQVLRAVAQLMSSALRESDIIGRYGGEEFAFILPETNNNAAIHAAERILAHVADVPIDTDAGKLSIQLSIGIAEISDETPTLQSLFVRADQAMYMAKTGGRNRLAVK